jgi:hypothetical protein
VDWVWKKSNQANRALYFGKRTSLSDQNIDTNDTSQSTPANTFTYNNTFANEALWGEVTYKVGGRVKVWNGSSEVEKSQKSGTGHPG